MKRFACRTGLPRSTSRYRLQIHSQLSPAWKMPGQYLSGTYSVVASGDYAIGTNHVLPTAGYAKLYSGLDVNHFCKTASVEMVSPEGLESIGDIVETIAGAEVFLPTRNPSGSGAGNTDFPIQYFFFGDSSVGTTTIHFCSLNRERIVSGLGNSFHFEKFQQSRNYPNWGLPQRRGQCPQERLTFQF